MLEVWLGLAAGLLVGSTGAGVGLLLTPLLVLLGGYRPEVAVATGLGALAASKLAGSISHLHLGHWPGRPAWALLGGGTCGVALALFFARHALASPTAEVDLWLKRFLGVGLITGAVGLLATEIARERRKRPERAARAAGGLLFLLGLGVGGPVGLTSLGSGTALSPLLVLTTRWSVAEIAAASNVYGLVAGTLGAVFHARLGFFDWVLFGKVLAGLLPGVGAGALLSRVIPRHWMARGFGMAGIGLGVRLLLG